MFQEQYWNEMVQVRSHVFYLEMLLENNQKVDRQISCFMAIASSTSIAGWVVWRDYSFVWALIIALSQAITAIRNYLPYSNRIKNLKQASRDMNEVLIHAETQWIFVSNGSLTDEEVQMQRLDVKRRANAVIDKGLGADPIPKDKHSFQHGEQQAELYFQRYYPVARGIAS